MQGCAASLTSPIPLGLFVGAELSDEVDEIEDFEHALAEHIDATTQKRCEHKNEFAIHHIVSFLLEHGNPRTLMYI